MPPTQHCPWAKNDLAVRYHDEEWGVPVRDDNVLFEFLILEGAQAGLSWDTILAKRDHYRKVYRGFDPALVARFDKRKVAALLNDAGIVRNRLKVESSISNARAFLKVQDAHGGFAPFIWQYVEGKAVQNRYRQMSDVPAVTPTAERVSRDLKKLGFRFVGPTIIYAFMQAVGMVNDHLTSCPRHAEIRRFAG